MPRLRRNEWNFSSNAAEAINQVLSLQEFGDSLLGRAEAELSELRGAHRLDLVLFGRRAPHDPVVTGELKVPWSPEGRTPYNAALVNDAHSKASNCGALYFITWNIRRVVVWKTDDPGVALPDRVVYDNELVPTEIPVRSQADLDESRVKENIAAGIYRLVQRLDSLLSGPPVPSFLPLDRLFIARLEAALDFPIHSAAKEMAARLTDHRFKVALERWMRDVQGWTVTAAAQPENINRAARFSCYVLVNRLCFYNALRRKYQRLPRLSVANNVNTGRALAERLERAFNDAKRFTGDYETVFNGDFGDTLPFVTDEAVPEWRTLIRTLDHYDFANIGLDVIGAMYERLITPEERHKYGQHYTQPAVVDLINTFAIRNGREHLLDPSCGGGTFLVRGYARKAVLDGSQDHTQLLEAIYGCDVLSYACHLSTINLAIRDLIDDDNFPRVHLGDFLRYRPRAVFSHQPVRMQAGGLVTETRQVRIGENTLDAVVGNPPYISSTEMGDQERDVYHQLASTRWPRYPWRRASDINVYFWLHAATFLRLDGFLCLLTQAAWLDVDYGIPLQQWMLENFEVVAVLETEVEPWFTDARVATAVTILRRTDDAQLRGHNTVRFVQFRRRLVDIVGNQTTETDRQAVFEALRETILGLTEDTESSDFRARLVLQSELTDGGTDSRDRYVGSKWGRYLRSTETLYRLQLEHADRFVSLSTLAPVERGVTTNCDDFFLVTNISSEALAAYPTAREFRQQFAANRRDVEDGGVKIVRRSDRAEFALETSQLRPVMKTARDIRSFATSAIDNRDFAVSITEDRRHLTPFARRYVEAGEREEWHLIPSFESVRATGGNWYTLRDAQVSPVLFVKTMQYSPLVLLNDAGLIANQRLYKVQPAEGIDHDVLCAILNSTVLACERYAAVKALGREAAIDVEVFSANAFRCPDIRALLESDRELLRTAMSSLALREVGDLREDQLVDAGLFEARAYVASHPVSREIWPQDCASKAPIRGMSGCERSCSRLPAGWFKAARQTSAATLLIGTFGSR